MLSVYVLRLLPTELAAGRVVGEVEHVGTGSTAVVRSAEELVGFLAGRPDEEAGIHE
ncbi:MAG TPA: hypothetical protein VNF50_03490 [Acidimicrobiales bacterium]|nr:hypothetical protein [Acidimicrobiales bacterium]